MKKTLILVLMSVLVFLLLGPYITIGIKSLINKDILTGLQGDIYYTKRDNGVLTLYKSTANLDDEKLIYSHKNKGQTDSGDHNDNIIDFFYDKDTNKIDFIAINEGNFSVFSMDLIEERVQVLLNNESSLSKTDYIKNAHENKTAVERKGSIYITDNGKEKTVKKFNGIYDDKLTGYSPIGFSPDGNYLIYGSKEHLFPLVSLMHNLISDFNYNVYIMDLDTGKSARYIDAHDIQWVVD